MRALLHRKRAGMPAVDRIQDGGRAIAIEEGLTAYVFTMAAQHSFFTNYAHVPAERPEDLHQDDCPP